MTASMLLGDVAHRGAPVWGDRPAFVWQGRIRTYREMEDRVARTVSVLAEGGVGEGTRLAVLSMNVPEVIETCLAAFLLGAVVVPLNVRVTPSDLRFQVEDSGATHALIHHTLEPTAKECGLLDVAAWVIGPDLEDAVLRAERAAAAAARPSPDLPCIHLYTSGTTGRPKGCLLSQRSWLASNANLAHALSVGSEDRLLGLYPFFHVAGFGLALTHLLMGGQIVINAGVDPEEIWTLTERHRLTLLCLPRLQAMLTHPAAEKADRSSVRGVIGGANMESPKALELLNGALPNARFYGVYGSTEAGNFVTVSSEHEERARPGIGRPVLGFDVAVLDDADRPSPPAKPESWVCGVPAPCSATGTCRRRPPRRSGADGCTPATSCGSTGTDTSTSWTGPRT